MGIAVEEQAAHERDGEVLTYGPCRLRGELVTRRIPGASLPYASVVINTGADRKRAWDVITDAMIPSLTPQKRMAENAA